MVQRAQESCKDRGLRMRKVIGQNMARGAGSCSAMPANVRSEGDISQTADVGGRQRCVHSRIAVELEAAARTRMTTVFKDQQKAQLVSPESHASNVRRSNHDHSLNLGSEACTCRTAGVGGRQRCVHRQTAAGPGRLQGQA